MGLRHWIQSEPLPSSRWKSSWSPGTAPTRLVGMDLVIIVRGHHGHCHDRHLYCGHCGHHDHRDNQDHEGYYYPIHDNNHDRDFSHDPQTLKAVRGQRDRDRKGDSAALVAFFSRIFGLHT